MFVKDDELVALVSEYGKLSGREVGDSLQIPQDGEPVLAGEPLEGVVVDDRTRAICFCSRVHEIVHEQEPQTLRGIRLYSGAWEAYEDGITDGALESLRERGVNIQEHTIPDAEDILVAAAKKMFGGVNVRVIRNAAELAAALSEFDVSLSSKTPVQHNPNDTGEPV